MFQMNNMMSHYHLTGTFQANMILANPEKQKAWACHHIKFMVLHSLCF